MNFRDNPQMGVEPEYVTCDDVNRPKDTVLDLDPQSYGAAYDPTLGENPLNEELSGAANPGDNTAGEYPS